MSNSNDVLQKKRGRPDASIRRVTIFVSSPTDVMAERGRAARVIDRLQSRYRDYVTIAPFFFEEPEYFFSADKSPQEQIPDAGGSDLMVSIFWSKLGTPLPPDLFGTMPDGKPYPGGAVYELMRAIAAKRQRNLPDILVYRKVAETGISVTDPQQRRLMTAQLDAFEAFWKHWFVSEEGHFRAGFQTFHHPDDFERALEGHLRAWLGEQGLLGKEVVWRVAERGSPFRGLESYEPAHAAVFFGREREVDRGRQRLLAAATRGTGFLLIMGPSGAGKSSLAGAGLVPRLTQPGDIDGVDVVRFAMMRPGAGATPQAALAAALFRPEALPEVGEGDFPDPELLAAALSGDTTSATSPILRALDRLVSRLRAGKSYDRILEARLLIVVDQLEELFSSTVTAAARAGFIQLIAALARSGHVLVIATLRSSAYGALVSETELLGLKDEGATLDVPVPGPEVLAEIVRRPAAAAGLVFDRRKDHGLDEVLLATAGGNTDALPLLGFTLQWLFEHREGERLMFAAYDELGGLEGAIGRAAEKAFDGVGAEAQATLPQLLRGLAETSRNADGLALRNMPLADAPPDTPQRALADALVAARVIVIHGAGQDAMLRLAHDAVLRGWGRAREIAAREQDFYRIREEVSTVEQRWRNRRRSDLLLAPGLPLAEAQSLRTAYGAELDPQLCDFIDTSSRKARQRQRRGYVLAGVFACVAIAALGAGVLAWLQEQAANENRDKALLTQSRFLADLANQAMRSGDLSVGLVLALDALPDAGASVSRPYAPEAEATAFAGIQGLQELAILPHAGEVWSVAFSRDGKRLLTGSLDKTARLWDAASGKQLVTFTGHTSGVWSANFSPDERLVVTAAADDKIGRIWNTETGQELIALSGHERGLSDAAFSPDGKRVATASFDNTARIWDAVSGRQLAVLTGHRKDVQRVAFSSDGRRLFTVGQDESARVWDAETGREIVAFARPTNEQGFETAGWEATMSEDGRRVVGTSRGASAHVWDVESGRELLILKHERGQVYGVAFSRDGKMVATAGNDRTARIWNADTGASIAVLRHDAVVTQVKFRPDGEHLATTSADEMRVFEVETKKQILLMKEMPTMSGAWRSARTACIWRPAPSETKRRACGARSRTEP
jgi:hypothetical protein